MTTDSGTAPAAAMRTSGMRDLGPEEMARFRAVERVFLEVAGRAGCAEIRTPAIEPLHLYTSSGALSPQLLDRVYSFLDWDGWSGERVVLRPDATVAAARWYCEQALEGAPRRLSYVQPVYRFEPPGQDREVWQCGVEFFGLPAEQGDVELLLLARDLLAALGARDLRVDLAHAGLARAAFAAAGLDPAEQIVAYDRMVEGDAALTQELIAAHPEGAAALRLLADVDGTSAGYVANLRAAMLPVVPGAATALDDLERVVRALEEQRVPVRVLPGTARNLEYYSGVTFEVYAGETQCIAGGRYDGLTEAICGMRAPACGFGAAVQRLASLGGAR